MYQIEVKIRGLAPILFNRFFDVSGIDGGSTGGAVSREQRVAEAGLKMWKNDAGELCIPGHSLEVCIQEGATKASLKFGKKALAPFLEATVFVTGDPSFGVTEPDGIHECVGRRPPRTGGACLIRRPMLRPGWELPFIIDVVDQRRDPNQIRVALEEAGLLVGLADGRPRYGRFLVTDWELSEGAPR